MAGSPIDDRIEAILAKYDLWDPEQYSNAVAELVSYLLTVDPKEERKSLYYQSIQQKKHLENCLILDHEPFN
jgi:hypothetical protein